MTDDNQKFLNYVILSQCFGQIASLTFHNGVMFTYFDSLNSGESNLILLLKLPALVGMLMILPLAFWADRFGKKKLGQAGNGIQVIGVGLLILAPWFTGFQIGALYIGVLVFAIGCALFNSSWFALLDPLVSKDQRGPFFAKMRTCWKFTGIMFAFLAQYMLGVGGTPMIFQLLIIVFVFSIVRMYFYHNIAELEKPEEVHKKTNFRKELGSLIEDKSFKRYSIFRFCFPLMTGCIALIFNLYEKKFMGFGPDDIVFMGNLMFIGSICGFWIGARLVKSYTEPQVFMMTTTVIALCCICFPLHGFIPVSSLVFAGIVTFIYGCTSAVFGISCTSLMLALLQPERKSLASSFCIAVTQLGGALSGIFAALVVKKDWGLEQMVGYDNIYSIILLCSVIPLPFVTKFLTSGLEGRN